MLSSDGAVPPPATDKSPTASLHAAIAAATSSLSSAADGNNTTPPTTAAADRSSASPPPPQQQPQDGSAALHQSRDSLPADGEAGSAASKAVSGCEPLSTASSASAALQTEAMFSPASSSDFHAAAAAALQPPSAGASQLQTQPPLPHEPEGQAPLQMHSQQQQQQQPAGASLQPQAAIQPPEAHAQSEMQPSPQSQSQLSTQQASLDVHSFGGDSGQPPPSPAADDDDRGGSRHGGRQLSDSLGMMFAFDLDRPGSAAGSPSMGTRSQYMPSSTSHSQAIELWTRSPTSGAQGPPSLPMDKLMLACSTSWLDRPSLGSGGSYLDRSTTSLFGRSPPQLERPPPPALLRRKRLEGASNPGGATAATTEAPAAAAAAAATVRTVSASPSSDVDNTVGALPLLQRAISEAGARPQQQGALPAGQHASGHASCSQEQAAPPQLAEASQPQGLLEDGHAGVTAHVPTDQGGEDLATSHSGTVSSIADVAAAPVDSASQQAENQEDADTTGTTIVTADAAAVANGLNTNQAAEGEEANANATVSTDGVAAALVDSTNQQAGGPEEASTPGTIIPADIAAAVVDEESQRQVPEAADAAVTGSQSRHDSVRGPDATNNLSGNQGVAAAATAAGSGSDDGASIPDMDELLQGCAEDDSNARLEDRPAVTVTEPDDAPAASSQAKNAGAQQVSNKGGAEPAPSNSAPADPLQQQFQAGSITADHADTLPLEGGLLQAVAMAAAGGASYKGTADAPEQPSAEQSAAVAPSSQSPPPPPVEGTAVASTSNRLDTQPQPLLPDAAAGARASAAGSLSLAASAQTAADGQSQAPEASWTPLDADAELANAPAEPPCIGGAEAVALGHPNPNEAVALGQPGLALSSLWSSGLQYVFRRGTRSPRGSADGSGGGSTPCGSSTP